MYGTKLPVVAGVSLLPATGHNRLLFIIASSLIVGGLVIAAVDYVVARKSRRSKAN